MKRREFLSSTAAGGTIAAVTGGSALAQTAAASNATGGREYYELRCYRMQAGPQGKAMDQYVAEALIPGLNRLGMPVVGAFELYIGPETPALYVLIPAASLETLVNSEARLFHDDEYRKAAEPFLKAPAREPAYLRMESSLMIAFEGWPKLVVPPVTSSHGDRVFQLRTYESPGSEDHRIKVQMFNNGEFEIFRKAGFWNVFFGDTLVGARMPNLTYMLSFPDLAELNAKWKAFGSDPDWKKLTSSPTYNFESIVSNITNLILNPKSYSQI